MSRFNPLFTFSTLFILTLIGSSAQAQFYWVGGSGNWSDFENHWATSSGGDTFHTAVPSSSDDVYFDENSFTAADQELILDSGQGNCNNFDCSGILNNPTFTAPQDLNIYGSAAFSGQASYVLDDVAVNFGDGVSLMGIFSSPMRSGYCGAKHALHGFFDALRAEHHKDNIGVTIICPGFIRTDISIKALTGDGQAQGTMDKATNKGISPEQCASKMAKAIAKGKAEVYIGKKEILAIYLKRYFPGILRRIIRKAAVT